MSAQPNLVEPARPAYITPRHYIRQATGVQTSGLVAAIANTTAAVVVGATTLPVDSALGWTIGALVTISDGSLTENVLCSAVGVSSLTISPTQFAHAGGTCVSAPGASGSLADAIAEASAEIDNYCRRTFFAGTITETLPLVIDTHGRLFLRPSNAPVASVTSAVVVTGDGVTLPIDLTNSTVQIEQGGAVVYIFPALASTNYLLPVSNYFLPRGVTGVVQLVYQGGFTIIPQDVQRACVWLTSDLLADQWNSAGYQSQTLGSRSFALTAKGTTVLRERAEKLLSLYRRKF